MDGINEWLEPEQLLSVRQTVEAWLMTNVLTVATLGQAAIIGMTLVISRLLAPRLRRVLDARVVSKLQEAYLRQAAAAGLSIVTPMLWLLLLWLAMLLAARAGLGSGVLRVVISLLVAWVVIRLVSSLVRDPDWSRAAAIVAWTVAALNILGLLDDALDFLDGIAFSIGNIRISALGVIKAAALMAALLWIASRISGTMERRVQNLPRLPASLQLLFGKLFKIVLFGIAVLIALSSIGIDVTALAVFTGAVGVGIGFGLQAVISNFVAGLILLLERSLKVGDFIELPSGARCEVRDINIRNTVVTTNDNIDIIVPDSEFMSGSVINWTFRDSYRRLRVPFGVAYGTDKELVRKAGLEAAAVVEHTLTGQPRWEPQVWLVGFGDSSLNFELVVWLTPTAVKRPSAVNAAYCWALDTALARHEIEIPFPQRDLRIVSATPLRVEQSASAPEEVPMDAKRAAHPASAQSR